MDVVQRWRVRGSRSPIQKKRMLAPASIVGWWPPMRRSGAGVKVPRLRRKISGC